MHLSRTPPADWQVRGSKPSTDQQLCFPSSSILSGPLKHSRIIFMIEIFYMPATQKGSITCPPCVCPANIRSAGTLFCMESQSGS